jgi:signal transduction histidine kinase
MDLKLRLTLRIAALASLCFIATFAYTLVESDRSTRAKADWIAGIVAQDLELQEDQRHWVKIAAADPLPDLQRIAAPLIAPGLCIAYRTRSGELLQRLCSGTQAEETAAPAAFATLYKVFFRPNVETVRQVLFQHDMQGAAVVSLDAGSVIAQAWHDSRRIASLMAIILATLCLLVYATLARALRSTRVIASGLKQLAENDLSTRLPAFELAELSAIRDVFNKLAETLQTTLAERNELTQRLIAVQDEERLHLARELHDEFGQCLAAISAVAAAASQTARDECPALLPECQTIAQTAAHMMEALRGALIRLRTPDVEEFGLAASLESLVWGWNGRSRGRTRFEIEIAGSFDSLPSSFAASLYRIAQEGITNAAKHAEATRVGLHLRMSDSAAATTCTKEIDLFVADDGKANDIDLASRSGMGLLGMQERVAALGGTLNIETRRPSGLILHAVIPAPIGG